MPLRQGDQVAIKITDSPYNEADQVGGIFGEMLGAKALGTLLAIAIGWEMETTPISECLS